MNHMNMNGANMPNGMGGMAGMQAGPSGGALSRSPEELDFKAKLNTYIYDYLLKNEQYDAARSLLNSNLNLITKPANSKKRPNGMGGDAMDTDSKDNVDLKRPDDLPEPDRLIEGSFENSFLLDWFALFWEVFWAPRQQRPNKLNPNAVSYMNHAKEQSRLQNEHRNNMLRQPGMVPTNLQYHNMVSMGMQPRNPRLNPAQMQNLTPQQQQNILQRQQIMQHQQNMERGGSDVEMNGGPRPRSPNGENAPSPSKRPRLETPQLEGNMSMMPNGRVPQMMHGQQVVAPGISEQRFLMHHVTDPSFAGNQEASELPSQKPPMQKKSLDVYSQSLAQQQRSSMQVPTMANQSTAMMQNIDMANPDFYANGQMRPGMPQAPNGQGGNHALQDYQMQLMLLEQQNKKRLLMARQEQDNLRPDQQGNMGGQQAFAPGMSPQGSRSGPSPNPSDQMKRGTPKLNQSGLPGSPMPDGNIPGRGSPGAMNFNNGTMPMEMMKAMSNMGEGGMQMGPNGANMRPPSSHPFTQQMNQQQQMEVMRAQAQQNGRLANGANWPQGPQGQAQIGPQTGQAPVIGTPQSRNAAMPPPQNVPAAGNNQNQAAQNQNMNAVNANNNVANGRPASPAPSATATTPQTTNKANPKKPKAEKERKRPNKKNTATAATPSADADNPPPTPQPPTPATPMHQKSFNENKGGQGAATNTQSVAPAPAPAPQVAQPQADAMMSHFPDIETGIEGNTDISMDFGGLEGEDVLNQFDFDQFISNDASHEFDLSAFGTYDGLEAPTDV